MTPGDKPLRYRRSEARGMTPQSDRPYPGDVAGSPLSTPVAVTSVTVVPMTQPSGLPASTVVIEDARVTQVGPADEVSLPPGCRVVDGAGRFLVPGLADMHAHYGDAGQFIMFLAGGVTRIRNMWGNEFHLSLRERIAAREFPGPRVNTTGPITDGRVNGEGIYPGTALIDDPTEADELIAGFAAAGYNAVKVYSYLSPDCLRAIGTAAARHGMPVVGHCPTGMRWEDAMDGGMTSFEHLLEIGTGRLCAGREFPTMTADGMKGYAARMQVEIESLDRDAVRRLAGQLAERNVWNCPTITVNGQFAKDPEEALGHPAMKYLPSATRDQWARRAARIHSGEPGEMSSVYRRYVDFLVEVVGLLHQEGAPLLLGTDAGSPLTPQGFTVVNELEYFVAAGLTPFEAIEAGTTAVASYLGRDDFGTIAPGQAADLLLLESDPLADVSAFRQISAVFTNGFLFERSDLDRLLAWREQHVEETIELPETELGPMATKTWWAR